MAVYQLSFYNPFREVFETKTYPHAATYRHGFQEHVKKAFYVLAGKGLVNGAFSNKFDEREKHLGLLDYLTFGVMYGAAKLYAFASKKMYEERNQPSYTKPLGEGFAVLILGIVGFGLRYLLAGVLTLLALPIIGTVTYNTRKEREALLTNVKKIDLLADILDPDLEKKTTEDFSHIDNVAAQNLRKQIHANALEVRRVAKVIEKPAIDCIDLNYKSSNDRIFLAVSKLANKHNPNFPSELLHNISEEEQSVVFEENVFIPASTLDHPKSVVSAMIKLNIGGIAQKLEARGFFSAANKRSLEIDTTKPLEEPQPGADVQPGGP